MTLEFDQDFFGKSLDVETYDAILMARWKDKDRNKEVELMRKKWFDMRLLHPTQATYLFAHLFTQEIRKMIRDNINNTPAVIKNGRVVDWEPIKAGDIFEPSTVKDEKKYRFWKSKITALIHARQTADFYCIPYSFYIKQGLTAIYFGKFNLLNSASIPQPSMLIHKDVVVKILNAWMSSLEGKIYCAEHPRYLIKNFNEHIDCSEHEIWLCDQIARKSNPNLAIRKFFDAGFLSKKRIIERFGAAKVPI